MSTLVLLYKTTILLSLFYAAPIWLERNLNYVIAVQNNFIRTVFSHGFSPNIDSYLGIPDVSAKNVSAETWRRTFWQKYMPERLRLKTFIETFRMICGAYPVHARSPSPSQRPAPTTIASRSPFPLGLCSCTTSLCEMGI